MKIVHTSDIHIDSPITAHLDPVKAARRRKELTDSLARVVRDAVEMGAAGFIIAGDLFDRERVSRRSAEAVLAIIHGAPRVHFFYLPGNHEGDALLSSGAEFPKNLHVFNTGWTYYRLGDVNIVGRSEVHEGMFDTLQLDGNAKNLVVLHGELRDGGCADGVIGIRDIEGKSIDYLALGHYHKYSEKRIDRRCTAVYSGTPEGRGFDETGECGYAVIDTAGDKITHRFIRSATRKLQLIKVDVGGAHSQGEVEYRASLALERISDVDLVRLELVGGRSESYICDTDSLYRRFGGRFFYFEVKDSTSLEIRAEDYRCDRSLAGEFVRLVMADGSLGDDERDAILTLGLHALRGEAIYER